LKAEPWRQEAACIDEAEPSLFFNEPTNARYRPNLERASLLLPLLICAAPVRRPCLAAALDPPIVVAAEDDRDALVQQVFGVWGASTEHDRREVRHLPTAAAIDELESTLAARIAARVGAWRAGIEARPELQSGQRMLSKRDRRIEAMLSGA
jgi:hypothetical protein